MTTTNGHGPRRAVLYARVSTDEQARSGYSLAQQMEALRAYAAREGYEVLEAVSDPGQSGASLERPGMDRVRDLVAAGGVSVVLAQDRDRFAREPAYHFFLKREFAEQDTAIRALNDRGDGSPEGELTDGILDQLARYERLKMVERTRRGKLRRAREGKVIAGHPPNYGFLYNNARDNYAVDEATMPVVRRIFRMIAAEGHTIKGVKRVFDCEGVPTPSGTRYWSTTQIRETVLEDVYRPHTHEELKAIVAPEVAARLDPEGLYGVWWYNRRRTTHKTVAATGPDGGREYRRRQKATPKPPEEWIPVPVPDAGVPRTWVDAAREAIKDNRKSPSAGRRFWELSGGILRCGGCGRRMSTHSVTGGRSKKRRYFYYLCDRTTQHGQDACPQRSLRAGEAEARVWGFVSSMLKDPDRVRAGLDAMIEKERRGMRGDPEGTAKAWEERLAEADRMRAGYQELAAKGLMTFEELGEQLARLEEERATARNELEALRGRREALDTLERDREALLEHYAGLVPEALDALSPEERHRVYRMLRLEVKTDPASGGLEVTGVLRGPAEAPDPEGGVSETEITRSTCVTVDTDPENRLTVLAATSRVKIRPGEC